MARFFVWKELDLFQYITNRRSTKETEKKEEPEESDEVKKPDREKDRKEPPIVLKR